MPWDAKSFASIGAGVLAGFVSLSELLSGVFDVVFSLCAPSIFGHSLSAKFQIGEQYNQHYTPARNVGALDYRDGHNAEEYYEDAEFCQDGQLGLGEKTVLLPVCLPPISRSIGLNVLGSCG